MDEPNETIIVNLSNPVGAAIAVAEGVITIIDDDASPLFAPADYAFNLAENRDGSATAINVGMPSPRPTPTPATRSTTRSPPETPPRQDSP